MPILIVMLMTIAIGIRPEVAEAFLSSKKREQPIERAERQYENHEYYYARQTTQEILAKDPSDLKAQKLMAKILDAEVDRHKQHLLPLAIEEMDRDQKKDEIKTWLERSTTLLVEKQYDLALFAAEKVFLYEPDNLQASELIDKIKGQALKEGKADVLFLNKMYKEEIADRLTRYKNEAEALAGEGRLGQAQFTIKKVLLLEPEDPQALQLYQSILDQEGAQRHEA